MKLVLRILLLVLPQLFVLGKSVSFAANEKVIHHKKDALTYTVSTTLDTSFFEESLFDSDDEVDHDNNSFDHFSENPFQLTTTCSKTSVFPKNRSLYYTHKKLYLLFGNIKIPV